MPDPREKRVDLILQQLEELPTLPTVAIRVLEVAGDSSASVRDIVRLISADPALSARILQLVHRADAGVRGNIQSIERAVVLLGFDAVRSAVLAVSVFQSFGPQQLSDGHFNRTEFWKHCVAVACCAELLAESARPANVPPPEAFICGLLHDLGKIALDAVLPKSFSRVIEAADLLRGNIADIERNVIGLDHMVVGKRLAERWHLPQVIRDCIWLHGQDPRALPASVKNPRLVNLITLADQIVREQHLGYSGNYTFTLPRETLIQAAGLTPQIVEEAVKKLVGRIEPRAKSLGLGISSTTELFQQALAQANKELGRMTGQLASKNRRLTVRAQFFEALSRFQSELRPDASPQIVLQAIAQTAVSVLSVSCVAAFSLPPGHSYAETLLCDADGMIFENSLIDLPHAQTSLLTPDPMERQDRSSALDASTPGQAARVDADSEKTVSPRRSGSGPRDENPGRRGGFAFSPNTATGAACPGVEAASDGIGPALAESIDASTIAGFSTHGHSNFTAPLPRPGDGPVLSVGDELEWLVTMVSPRLPADKRFWICMEADGHCVGGIVWGAPAGESQRLGPQVQELATLASGWALALRTAQIREEARALSEHLAEANRQLHNAQSEILRSRTLLTVGEMAAGAAHEMNNPLAVISGRSQILSQQLADPKLKAAAYLIGEQCNRLSAIITELMDFAKPESPVIRQAQIAEVIDTALREAKSNNDPADRRIEVTLGEVPMVAIDARQVSAAVTEVIENAIHATEAKAGHIHLHAAYDPYSSRVVVTVTDNGCGMDESTLKRAFDPFFSAKPAGRRRGLGLAKALRWIEASGGSIRLESRPGQGTRTVILLPASSSGMGILPMSGEAKESATA